MGSLTLALVQDRAETSRAAAILFLAGTLMVVVVGLSHIENVHDAAHDTRHALSFPCH